ncbi:RDD family protein [Actinomadura craniellae]|uniref:RDD family protein n=1 Tax=Actinomadura craniellae TaxID=2231787 RepID=A0A365H5N8_9ACTN|nr:RDD family protein [Actinomadura craniellae]RAY14359.1 RDD family protein [Actinomadura craniellae]
MTQPPQPGDQPWQQPPGQPPPYGTPPGDPYGWRPYGEVPAYPDPAAGLASRWARLGAAIVDGILLSAATALLSLPFIDWGRVVRAPDADTVYVPTGQWAATLIGVVLALLYFWLLHARWGQTLGKRLLGIRVVRAVDGGPVDNSQALLRAAVYTVLGGFCSCFFLIDVAWILWDRRRQALHDKAARTVVERAGARPDPYAGR